MVLSATDKVSKSGGNLSPVPCFDRSDSVTPTNELIDEEASLTPKSVSPLNHPTFVTASLLDSDHIMSTYMYLYTCISRKLICILYMHVYSTVAKRERKKKTTRHTVHVKLHTLYTVCSTP